MISGSELLFGKIALREGLLTTSQLQDALSLQGLAEPRRPLGKILVEQGTLTADQVQQVLNQQHAFYPTQRAASLEDCEGLLFGTIAVLHRFCGEAQIHDALRIQAAIEEFLPIGIGEILLKLKVLTPRQVRQILALQHRALYACRRCDVLFNFLQHDIDERNPRCPYCDAVLITRRAQRDGMLEGADADDAGNSRPTGNGREGSSGQLTPTAGATSRIELRTVEVHKTDGTTSRELVIREPQPDATPFTLPESRPLEPVDLASAEVPPEEVESRRLGPYVIMRELGRGGMGVVYLARHINDAHPRHAVKFLRRDLSQNEAYLARFKRETHLAQQLRHENIVSTFETGERDGFHFLVMEYVNGVNLGELLDRVGKLPLARAIDVVRQTATALSHAHKCGIVHRDIKPDNIILTTSSPHAPGREVAKITDFGLAKELAGFDDLTITGQLIGTPHYMSPEQCRGKYSDQRSDIYSLGATLYHLVTGRAPFTGDNSLAIMEQHKLEPIVPPHELSPNISSAVSFLIGKMMEKSPNDRYPTMELLVEHLELWDSDALGAQIERFSKPFARVRLFDRSGPDARTPANEALAAELTRVKQERDRAQERLDRFRLLRARRTRSNIAIVLLVILCISAGIIIGLLVTQ